MTSSNQIPNTKQVEIQETIEDPSLNILLVGTDLNFAKTVQVTLQSLKSIDPPPRLFPGPTLEKITELLEKQTFHSILVDEEFLTDRTPEQFVKTLSELRAKSPKNAKAPLILISVKTTLTRTKQMVRAGWYDVLIKPLDSSLFLQKLNLYNADQEFLKEELLFSMDMEKEVELAFHFKTKSISEYGMKVESRQSLEVGTVLGVLGEFLNEPLAAVVRSCKSIGENLFAIELMFIGITPAETQSIRKLIRQEYAEEKQAA